MEGFKWVHETQFGRRLTVTMGAQSPGDVYLSIDRTWPEARMSARLSIQEARNLAAAIKRAISKSDVDGWTLGQLNDWLAEHGHEGVGYVSAETEEGQCSYNIREDAARRLVLAHMGLGDDG